MMTIPRFLYLAVFILTINIVSPTKLLAQHKKPKPDKIVVHSNKKLEEKLIDEINDLRGNPSKYVELLKKYRDEFRGKTIKYSDGRVITTNEGAAALDEALEFLANVPAAKKIERVKELNFAAEAHLIDITQSGKFSHTGSNGSKPMQRVERFGGRRSASIGEINTIDAPTAREIVFKFLIDDGVKSRSHRKSLFNPAYKNLGVSFGDNEKFRYLCVIVLSGDLEKIAAPPINKKIRKK